MKCERCEHDLDRKGLTITETYQGKVIRFCSYLCRFIWHEEHFVEAVRPAGAGITIVAALAFGTLV